MRGTRAVYVQYTRTGWRSYVKCLIFIGHVAQKSPIISGSFVERDLQLIRHPMHLRHPVRYTCWNEIISSHLPSEKKRKRRERLRLAEENK